MIKLDIYGYCHGCPYFEAEVERPMVLHGYGDSDEIIGDTVIRCENRKKCERIADYIERQLKGENDDC